MSQLVINELKALDNPPRRSRRVRSFKKLQQRCLKRLEFLKSKSFDCAGKPFAEYEASRALEIFCIQFKWMYVNGISAAEHNCEGVKNRGNQVVLNRSKRRVSVEGKVAYDFAKLHQDISVTNAVSIERAYCTCDHKSQTHEEKKADKARRTDGLLLYFVTSTPDEAQELLRILMAWGETAVRRNAVFAKYPGLLERQKDSLSPEQDAKRSKARQCMLRKKKSTKPKPGTDETREQHAEQEEKNRDRLCREAHWDDEDFELQKEMYHFARTSSSNPVSFFAPNEAFALHTVAGC